MIRLITDMMSDPRIQARVIQMLEKHLQGTDVRKATHLVLMAMEVSSTSFLLNIFLLIQYDPFNKKLLHILNIITNQENIFWIW